jgi:uncharacterized protein
MTVNDINQFRHQQVRDLAWVIASPPLVELPQGGCCWPDAAWYRDQYMHRLAWLQQLDRAPDELLSLVAKQKDRRLGKYFETLWFFWLQHHPGYEVLAHNLQVIIDGVTIGEIDLVLRDIRRNTVIHVELAVKFYLGLGQLDNPASWHGPHMKDRLDLKLGHMLNRQIAISQREDVRRWLLQQGISIDRCAVIFKGRLYYPVLNDDSQPAAPTRAKAPNVCGTEHLTGCWTRQSLLPMAGFENARFLPLLNSGWMGQRLEYDQNEILDLDDINKIDSNNKLRLPMHVQQVSDCNKKDKWFIVSNDWGVQRI